MTQNCGNCGYSWTHDEDGNVSCGAPVNDEALRGGPGNNPIWANRKYGPIRLLMTILTGDTRDPEGSNPEKLSPNDGATCKTWRSKTPA